jgi:hypothetical protein
MPTIGASVGVKAAIEPPRMAGVEFGKVVSGTPGAGSPPDPERPVRDLAHGGGAVDEFVHQHQEPLRGAE